MSGTVDKAVDMEAEKIIVVERWKGGPGRIRFYRTSSEAGTPLALLILGGVKTQIDFGGKRRLPSNLVVAVTENPSKETAALAQFLSTFLKIPFWKERTREGQFNAVLRLSTIHEGETQIQFFSLPPWKEVGPRLMVRRTVWENAR